MFIKLSLLLRFTRQDMIDRHASAALGALWTFILPLSQILIFTLIFSNVMGLRLMSLGLEDLGQYSYSVYLVIGLLAWLAFSNTISRVTQVYQDKAGLIHKVHLPLLGLPLYIPLSELIYYAIGMAFFTLFLFFIGFQWTWYWLWLVPLMALLFLLAYALGLLFALLSVFIRDTRDLVGIGLQLLFWMTPIVYVMDLLPARWHWIFQFNPLYHLINALRSALLVGTMPPLQPLIMIFLMAVALLSGALWLGRRLEKDLRDFI
ncbi:ABC transporter permease [Marinospirillum sp. MEB164]|uniref:Transport permease protein n=1 Tax=Marinospirillum alkalitolerans TaxID=3123374 RepID=A0ABW8PUZ4_9GAMM